MRPLVTWPALLGILAVLGCGGSRPTRAWSRAEAPAPRGAPIANAGDDCAIAQGVLQLEYDQPADRACEAPPPCVRRSRADAGLVSVGTFVHDDGCVWLGTVVDGRYYPTWTSARPVLARLGWATADGSARASLILRWLREATSLQPVEEPDRGPVTAPRFVASADGSATYTIWLTRSVTATREDGAWVSYGEYVRHRLHFSADGELQEVWTDKPWSDYRAR